MRRLLSPYPVRLPPNRGRGSPLRRILTCGVACLLFSILLSACQEEVRSAATWVCPPCAPHDTLTFEEDGVCPVCGMKLFEKPDSSHVGHADIHAGSGTFVMEGGAGHEEKLVTVFYHRPESFTPESPILLVVPGAGRNAWDYRDAWVEASERHGVLVLSPHYPEQSYDFGEYHLGGLVEESNLVEVAEFVEGSDQVRLDEELAVYELNSRPEEWIFSDFDRLFELAADAVGSTRTGYDAFGHSAGGQVLHRMVLLRPDTRARRILASNSGFYTLPDPEAPVPFGLDGTPVTREDLEASFRQRLVLFLGAEDDHPEAGGTFLRSSSADAQGLGRLQRGRYFYERGEAMAEELGVDFRWELEVVPGVSHDSRGMSAAAAEYLYGNGGAGYRERLLEHREDHESRVLSSDLLPDGLASELGGLRYFAVDSTYRFVVRLERLGRPDTVFVPSSSGRPVRAGTVGSVRIPFPSDTVRMTVFGNGGDHGGLWIPFRDLTSGRETYAAGRYVPVREVGGGSVVVDFNRAFNPSCAYGMEVVCPLPPPENRISHAVRAGEKAPMPNRPREG